MKCQSLSSGKNKKNIVNLPSAEFAHRMVKVKETLAYYFILRSFVCFLIIFKFDRTPTVLFKLPRRYASDKISNQSHLILKHDKQSSQHPVPNLALDSIYTGLVTMVQVLYLLEICCPG